MAFELSQKRGLFLLAGLMLLVFILRVYHLPGYPYHEDDIASINIMSLIAKGNVPWGNQVFLRSPLGHLLMSVPLFVADTSPYATRLASVVFSLLLMPFLWLMGKEAHGPSAGLMAATFLGFSSYQNLFASFARFYPAFQFFFISSVFFAGTFFILKKGGMASGYFYRSLPQFLPTSLLCNFFRFCFWPF